MTIAQAVDWLAVQAAAVTGVAVSTGIPDYAIGTNSIWFVCYDQSAVLSSDAASQYRDLYTIRCLLVLAGDDMKSAILSLRGLPVSIANKVRADPTMGGYVQTYDQITYQFVPALEWQGVKSIGYVIDVTGVKIRPTA